MPSKVWDEITCPFLNFNGATIFYNGCNYLFMLGLTLNHVSKRGPRSSLVEVMTWCLVVDNHYISQWRPSTLTYRCITRLYWLIKSYSPGLWASCDVILTTTLALLSMSSFSLVGITITRYISIRDPLKFPLHFTHRRALAAVVTTWVFVIAISCASYVRNAPGVY